MLKHRRKMFAALDPSKLSPAWMALTEAIRVLIGQTRRSLRAIQLDIQNMLDNLPKDERELRTRYGYLNRSVLWDLACGNRKRAPKEAQLWQLHRLALAVAGATEVISWDKLDKLRLDVAAKPAENTEPSAPDIAPVPRADGDRRNIKAVDVIWQPVNNLATYASIGSREGALGLIRHVGIEAAPTETAHAVISCRDLGLFEEVEAIISYAGNRPERDVLHIMHSLKQHDRQADADALLDRALARAS